MIKFATYIYWHSPNDIIKSITHWNNKKYNFIYQINDGSTNLIVAFSKTKITSKKALELYNKSSYKVFRVN